MNFYRLCKIALDMMFIKKIKNTENSINKVISKGGKNFSVQIAT